MKRSLLIALGAALSASVSSASLVGLWEFENTSNIGQASIGNDLGVNNTNNTIIARQGVNASDGAVEIGVGDYFTVIPDIAANGGGSFVNEFSIVYDVFLPTSTNSTWRSLLQTNNVWNGNDGDYFVSSGNVVGVAAINYSSSTLAANDWYRIVFSADIGSTTFGGGSFQTTVLDSNGNLLWSFDHAFQATDGRHSLYAATSSNVAYFFADNDGEDNLVYVTAIGLYDETLDTATAQGLGAPGSAIPEPRVYALIAGLGAVALAIYRRRRS